MRRHNKFIDLIEHVRMTLVNLTENDISHMDIVRNKLPFNNSTRKKKRKKIFIFFMVVS